MENVRPKYCHKLLFHFQYLGKCARDQHNMTPPSLDMWCSAWLVLWVHTNQAFQRDLHLLLLENCHDKRSFRPDAVVEIQFSGLSQTSMSDFAVGVCESISKNMLRCC